MLTLNKKPSELSIQRVLILSIAIVGMAGFEPAASTSQMWRDTGLRYIPIGIAKVAFYISAANFF